MRKIIISLLLGSVFISGCGYDHDMDSIRKKVNAIKITPNGTIDPTPEIKAYKSAQYQASLIRSPFIKPVKKITEVVKVTGKKVEPDLSRLKDELESFGLDDISMVGTLKKDDGGYTALLKDSLGKVHFVSVGNYLGQNHGKVIEVNDSSVSLMEIVSDGADSWVERPAILSVAEE